MAIVTTSISGAAPGGTSAAPDGVGGAGAVRRISAHPVLRFVLRRLWHLAISLLVLITASFLMIQLIPGDPVRAALGATAAQETVEAQRELLGLDEPLPVQYWSFVSGVFTGDLGVSLVSQVPVTQIIAERLPATLQIAALAYAVTFAVGIPLGVVMARLTRNGRRPHVETAFTTTGITLATIPDFVVTVGMVAIFGVALGWLPVAGQASPASYIIPVTALSLGGVFLIARLIRLDMLRVLGTDFIRATRSKRIGVVRTTVRHALPNALTATLTVAGLTLGSMLAGTVLVENVLAWPGLGREMVNGIVTKNYPVVQGVILVYGVMILVLNLVIDLVIGLIDPRVAMPGSDR